jgi:hypothetical protein
MAKQFGNKHEEDKIENENVESVGVAQTEQSSASETTVDTETFTDQEWEEAHRENRDRNYAVARQIEEEIQEGIVLEFLQPKQEPQLNAIQESPQTEDPTEPEENIVDRESQQKEFDFETKAAEHPEIFAWTDEDEGDPEKRARRIWKRLNPADTLKHQEQLVDSGFIEKLPWKKYVEMSEDELAENYTSVDFGTTWPPAPIKGDAFIRVDYLPSRLYKYNGQQWIEVDKNSTDTFTYNDEYINHLIEKLGTGEYDPDLLNDAERQQIEDKLKNQDL